MTNEMQEKVFNYIQNGIEKIGDFAAKEVPPFIQEYLQWKFYESIAYISMWGFVTLACIITMLVIRKRLNEWDGFAFPFISLMLAAILGAVFFCDTMKYVSDAIQIKIAPKVYLVEKVKELVK